MEDRLRIMLKEEVAKAIEQGSMKESIDQLNKLSNLYQTVKTVEKDSKVRKADQKEADLYTHIGYTGCNNSGQYKRIATIDLVKFCKTPKESKQTWWDTTMVPQMKKTRRLQAIAQGPLSEIFISGKFIPDCVGEGKVYWGLSCLMFGTQEASKIVAHQRKASLLEQATHKTVRDLEVLLHKNPEVPLN